MTLQTSSVLSLLPTNCQHTPLEDRDVVPADAKKILSFSVNKKHRSPKILTLNPLTNLPRDQG